MHSKIIMVSCGEAHVAIINNVGEVLTFGRGQNGRLGHGNEHDTKIPHVVQFGRTDETTRPRVSNICCGLKHTLALSEDHKGVT